MGNIKGYRQPSPSVQSTLCSPHATACQERVSLLFRQSTPFFMSCQCNHWLNHTVHLFVFMFLWAHSTEFSDPSKQDRIICAWCREMFGIAYGGPRSSLLMNVELSGDFAFNKWSGACLHSLTSHVLVEHVCGAIQQVASWCFVLTLLLPQCHRKHTTKVTPFTQRSRPPFSKEVNLCWLTWEG